MQSVGERELACPPAVTPVVMSKLPEEGGLSNLRCLEQFVSVENYDDHHDNVSMTIVVKAQGQ